MPSDKRPRVYACGAAIKRDKKRRLDNAVAGTSNISFFVTTTAGDNEPSDGNRGKCNDDVVDVAPPVPAPEGPVVQTWCLTTRRIALCSSWAHCHAAILRHGPCRPKGPFAISSDDGNRLFGRYGNRTAMDQLLAKHEEAILSECLVVRRSIGTAKRVGQRCVGPCDHRIRAMECGALIEYKKRQSRQRYLMTEVFASDQTFHWGWLLAFEHCVIIARTQKHTDRQRHKANNQSGLPGWYKAIEI